MMSDPVFTTGEVAKYTGVNFRTVIRWIERGELSGYKLPGRGDHRVTLSALLSFMADHQMPMPSEFTQHHKKVLVVDDDAAMANSFVRFLKQDGWLTQVALDGFEAGLALGQWQPSLMILDLKMPQMDGLKVLQLTRTNFTPAQLKILVVSAQGMDKLQSAIDMGADDILEKPIEKEPFMKVIRHWFGREDEFRSV